MRRTSPLEEWAGRTSNSDLGIFNPLQSRAFVRVIPSFGWMRRRCHSTVRTLRNRFAAASSDASRLGRPGVRSVMLLSGGVALSFREVFEKESGLEDGDAIG